LGLIVGSVVAGVTADRMGGGRAYTIVSVAMLVICGAFYLTLERTGSPVWPLYIAGGLCASVIAT
jgi:nitrate/nitrite transporter NarK